MGGGIISKNFLYAHVVRATRGEVFFIKEKVDQLWRSASCLFNMDAFIACFKNDMTLL